MPVPDTYLTEYARKRHGVLASMAADLEAMVTAGDLALAGDGDTLPITDADDLPKVLGSISKLPAAFAMDVGDESPTGENLEGLRAEMGDTISLPNVEVIFIANLGRTQHPLIDVYLPLADKIIHRVLSNPTRVLDGTAYAHSTRLIVDASSWRTLGRRLTGFLRFRTPIIWSKP